MVTSNYKITVWVRLHRKPLGLKCEMTVTPLEWVLGRDNLHWDVNLILELDSKKVDSILCVLMIPT